jgi:hypothetical protein
MSMARRRAAKHVVTLLAAALAAPALAADCPTGLFMAAAGPDTAGGLELLPDGRFRFAFSEGAVDEAAQGRWRCRDGTLLLTTEPTPTPAAFRLETVREGDAPFSLVVTWPDGRGVPAVDFLLVVETGEPVTGYTQADGWSADLDGRLPLSVQVTEPFYGTISPVFALPRRRNIAVRIVLDPHDMGTAAFADTPVTQADGGLILHWRGRAIAYERSDD